MFLTVKTAQAYGFILLFLYQSNNSNDEKSDLLNLVFKLTVPLQVSLQQFVLYVQNMISFLHPFS